VLSWILFDSTTLFADAGIFESVFLIECKADSNTVTGENNCGVNYCYLHCCGCVGEGLQPLASCTE